MALRTRVLGRSGTQVSAVGMGCRAIGGALAWIRARSSRTVPIPGFRSVAQVEENAGAMRHGPLEPAQVRGIDRLLGR